MRIAEALGHQILTTSSKGGEDDAIGLDELEGDRVSDANNRRRSKLANDEP